ncbi:MAG TPA: cupredoxin domain-containing protein [Candidatus Sulfomarinibacteraceae bacterium]|nr:cupredoxin domain-containing protein [Candidatus Sulfomarinibacteraceae bacterium]
MPDLLLGLLFGAAIVLAADLLLAGGTMPMTGMIAMAGTVAWPRLDPDGRQVVDVVVDRGYHPGTIVARAGRPLRLVFRRDDDDVCSERVVFSAPRLDRRLAATGVTTIDLPGLPPGEVRFTCGMGRYRGRIRLIGERAGARPPWLLPALLALAIVGALVAAGFVSLSTVLSVGLFGGMIPAGTIVPVEFVPGGPGEHEFTCQMGMPRGRIIVEAA